MSNHKVSSYITVNTAGQSWTITDPGSNLIYQVVNKSGGPWVYRTIHQYEVKTIESGQEWKITDTYSATTWRISSSVTAAGTSNVQSLLAYTPLYNPDRAAVTYLDLAVGVRWVICT